MGKTVEQLLTELEIGQTTILDVTTDEKGNKTLKFGLQPIPPEAPKRAETKARGHMFFAVEGFADYLVKHGNEGTLILANPTEQAITAILDERVKDGIEEISFEPQVHPLFAPWEHVIGKPVLLSEFVDFIRNNRRQISEPEGRELAMLLSQVRASINVSIYEGKGTKSINGVVVETKIQGQSKEEVVELPDRLTLRVPLYVGTEVQDINLDLNLGVAGNEDRKSVVIQLSAADLAEARYKAFEKFFQYIQDKAKAKNLICGFGDPISCEWVYLPRSSQGQNR